MMIHQYVSSMLPDLLSIVIEAGARVMKVYGSADFGVELKGDNSPLTYADRAAHDYIDQSLRSLDFSIPVVSEESEQPLKARTHLELFWLVDPLDGTKEFISKSGEFTVNIALIHNGDAVFGMVYAPAVDLLYWGGREFGAFCRSSSSESAIRVSARVENEPIRVLASKNHLNDTTQSFIDQLGPVELLQAGSSLKFCRIAEGAADLYPRLAPTSEWDTAAAQAVLEGAGGVVVDMQGKELRYGKDSILNPSFIAASSAALIPQ
jgi:3'(2'), 5'-bisphosphate nucleotidase